VHSERTAPELRRSGQLLHGIQAWVALPIELEESEPGFFHHPAQSLPALQRPGVALRVIAGSAFGQSSPVTVASPTFYVDASLEQGATLELPDEHAERACYVVTGELRISDDVYSERSLLVVRSGERVVLEAVREARVMLLGGSKLEGERHIDWNFVSSSAARIERARADWQGRRFPLVPGDEIEFTPLPERK